MNISRYIKTVTDITNKPRYIKGLLTFWTHLRYIKRVLKLWTYLGILKGYWQCEHILDFQRVTDIVTIPWTPPAQIWFFVMPGKKLLHFALVTWNKFYIKFVCQMKTNLKFPPMQDSITFFRMFEAKRLYFNFLQHFHRQLWNVSLLS